MKRTWWLVMVLVIFAGILAVAYFYLGAFLESAVRGGIDFVSKNLAAEGIELQDPDFEGVSIGLFPPSASVKALSAHMVITQHNALQIDRNFFINIDRVTVSLSDFNMRSFLFTVKGAVITMQPEYDAPYKVAKKNVESDKFEATQLQVPFQLNLIKRSAAISQLRALVRELAKFTKYGTTEMQMRFTGASAFVVTEKLVNGKLLLAPFEKGYKLVMYRNDFRIISEVLGERLTDAEFDVYCNNPLRMPRMLRIRNHASDQAYAEHKKNADVPEDAYKHVLWAYLLANAYDEKFSSETTDAHEINPIGRTELAVRKYLADERGKKSQDEEGLKSRAAIQMDLRNNAMGREYARNGYTETSLLERTMSDPRIVRQYSEIVDDL